MTEHGQHLTTHLEAFRRRIRLLLAERMLCWGVMAAGVVALVLVLVDLLTAWYVTPTLLGALAILGALAGVLYARSRPLSDLVVAVTVERRFPCKERASTAVALASDPTRNPELTELIIADATQHLAEADPKTLFPRKFTRAHRLALGAWAATFILMLLPALPWLYSPTARAERAAMHEAGTLLKQQGKELEQRTQTDLKDSQTAKKLARKIQKLGTEMQRNRLTKKDALVRMNKLEQELQKAEKQLAKERTKNDHAGMKQAADALRQALANRGSAEKAAAESARAKLAQGAKRENLTSQERKALEREEQAQQLATQLEQGDTVGATQTLNQVGQQMQSGNMSAAERKSAAESMQKLAEALQQTSQQQMAEGTQRAADKLRESTQQGQQAAGRALAQIPTPMNMPTSATSQSRNGIATARSTVASGQPSGMSGANSSASGMSGANGSASGMSSASSSASGNSSNGKGKGSCKGNGTCNNSGSCSGNGNCSGGAANGSSGGRGAGGTGPSYGGEGGGGLGNTSHNRLNANFTPKQEPGTGAGDPSYALSVEVRGSPDQPNRTNVPYYEVYRDYQKSAERAINNEQVPPSERERVKSYFNALDPGGQ